MERWGLLLFVLLRLLLLLLLLRERNRGPSSLGDPRRLGLAATRNGPYGCFLGASLGGPYSRAAS